MCRVNLFIIGANKSGSTWLHYLLDEHPDIYMSKRKEHYYFGSNYSKHLIEHNSNYPDNIQKYNSYFPFEKGYKYYGESTPHYYLDPLVAEQIKEYSPDAKIIAIVRDPINRLLSWIYFNKQLGNLPEKKSIESIIKVMEPRVVNASHYEMHFPRFKEIFGDQQFQIYSLEKNMNNIHIFWQEILEFLDLERIALPDISNRNTTGSRTFRFLYRNTIRKIAKKKPEIYKKLLKSNLMKGFKKILIKILGKAQKEELSDELYLKLLDEFKPTYDYLYKQGFKYNYKNNRNI